MNNLRFLSTVLAFSVFITTNAFAQARATSTGINKLEQVTLLNAFKKYSNKARESFLKNEMKLASEETRKALEVVKKDSLNATVEGKELLNESKEGLENLAKDLETGVSISEENFKKVFVGARNAIIKNHHYVTIERLCRQASNPTSIHY